MSGTSAIRRVPGWTKLPTCGGLVADDAVERRDDAGERQIAFRLGERRLEFAALAARFVALGLEDVEIGLGAFDRGDGRSGGRPGGGKRGGGAVAIGGRLFEPLLRAEIRLRELERTVVFERGPLDVGLRAKQLRLGRLHLGLGLGDDRALRFDLPAEAGDRRVLGGDAGLRRLDRVLIVAVVDRGEQVALMDDLVVDHRNGGQMARRLGGDDRGRRADIGVVGRDQETALDKIIVSRLPAIAERGEDKERDDEAANRPRAFRLNGFGRRRPAVGAMRGRNA